MRVLREALVKLKQVGKIRPGGTFLCAEGTCLRLHSQLTVASIVCELSRAKGNPSLQVSPGQPRPSPLPPPPRADPTCTMLS